MKMPQSGWLSYCSRSAISVACENRHISGCHLCAMAGGHLQNSDDSLFSKINIVKLIHCQRILDYLFRKLERKWSFEAYLKGLIVIMCNFFYFEQIAGQEPDPIR